VLSVGHDEYWSAEMRDHVDAFVDAGGRWGIFSGNTCFWQVRFDADGRRMTCHKSFADDPVTATDPARATAPWSYPALGRPENLSIGLSFTRGGYARIGDATPNSAGGFEVQRPDHWSLAGTGLRYGDQLGATACVVGYEVDGCELSRRDGLLVPTGTDGTPRDLDVIGVAPAHLLSITDEVCEVPVDLWASIDPPGDLEGVAAMLLGPDAAADDVAALGRGRAVMGEFRRGLGRVFVAGTADWAYGLDADADVQAVTANVLRNFLEPA
jgi:N,N-dimethylformamidase beta subunit-like, C-terminal